MKINPGIRVINPAAQQSEATVKHKEPKGFSSFMHQEEHAANHQQLLERLDEIDKQGERLIQSMTLRELHLYKSMVKRFLEDTARRAIGIRDTSGFDIRGRNRRYKLLEEIDTTLVSLAEQLLLDEQGRLQLLHQIGEIRGMLINISF